LLPRAAWAEHCRVKGTGSGESRPFCGCGSGGIPCSPPRCACSSTLLSPSPGALRGWSPGSPACDDRDHPLVRLPAKGSGRATTRVLGSLRRFMNRARDRSRCSSDRSEGHGAREAGFAIRQTSAFSTTGTRPNLTGEARLLWLGRCPRESFSRSPEFQGRLSPTPCSVKRESGPTAAPENDHCDSFQLAD